MAPNVIDVSALDGADLSALVANTTSKYPPLAAGIFDFPLSTPRETVNCQEEKKVAYAAFENDNCDEYFDQDDVYEEEEEDEMEEIIAEVLEYEAIRQLLKVENVEKRLIEASEDMKAKIGSDVISGVSSKYDDYWNMTSNENDGDDSEDSHAELFSAKKIEANLVRESNEQKNRKAADESIQAPHDVASWDYYWKFDANGHDVLVHNVLRHEEARAAVDVDRMRNKLIEAGKLGSSADMSQSETEACKDEDYWAWNDDHIVKADHDAETYDAYWNFKPTENDAAVDYVHRHEEARKAVHVENMIANLINEGKDRFMPAVSNVVSVGNGDGYWDW